MALLSCAGAHNVSRAIWAASSRILHQNSDFLLVAPPFPPLSYIVFSVPSTAPLLCYVCSFCFFVNYISISTFLISLPLFSQYIVRFIAQWNNKLLHIVSEHKIHKLQFGGKFWWVFSFSCLFCSINDTRTLIRLLMYIDPTSCLRTNTTMNKVWSYCFKDNHNHSFVIPPFLAFSSIWYRDFRSAVWIVCVFHIRMFIFLFIDPNLHPCLNSHHSLCVE